MKSTEHQNSVSGSNKEIKAYNWQYLSCLGEPDPGNITKQDLLQAIAFDKHGQLLAVGDRGGRVIVFQRIEEGGQVDFDYLTEFQSHETAFDPLNSTEIPEKINKIEWINQFTQSRPQMLTANDRLIKLWRIEYRKEKKFESCKKLLSKGRFAMPRSKVINEGHEGKCRGMYKNAHEYHIHSLSLASDGENFLSADDLRINIWHTEDQNMVYNVLDIKPKNIDELDEVMTHAEFSPNHFALLAYSTSKGVIQVCDFRVASSFNQGGQLKIENGTGKKKTIFSDLINAFSSVKFMRNYDHLLASRDYMTSKIWDIRNQGQPVATYHTTDYFEKNLCNLYEDDSIYDRFFMDISPCSKYMLTGAYNKSGHIIDIDGNYNSTITCDFNARPGKTTGKNRKYTPHKKLAGLEGDIDMKKKVMAGCWSPKEQLAALAFRNCIFLYLGR